MNIRKSHWTINERVDIAKREVLFIIAKSAGFRVAEVDGLHYKYCSDAHRDGGFVTYDGICVYETDDVRVGGRAQISYDEAVRRLKIVISHLNTNKK